MKPMILDWAYPTIADDYKADDTQWREITEECFDHFLNILPPMRLHSLGHVCSEPHSHTAEGYGVYTCCLKRFDGEQWRYFAKLATLEEFDRDRLHFEIPQ